MILGWKTPSYADGSPATSPGWLILMGRRHLTLQLSRRVWRATFYTTGMEESPTSATGTAWERSPWHATQRAAWEALKTRQ